MKADSKKALIKLCEEKIREINKAIRYFKKPFSKSGYRIAQKFERRKTKIEDLIKELL